MDPMTARVKSKALELGFTSVGIARAGILQEEGDRLRAWLDRGYQASMDWMAQSVAKRSDPGLVLPGVRSVIAVALNYYTDPPHARGAGSGRISRYAWGDDYHDLLGPKLGEFRDWLVAVNPGSDAKVYVDTGPVMDKSWAVRAGIGWLGKHTNVITREMGSWVFLGELLTTVDLEPDGAAEDRCGTCTLCIEACPTGAIVEPYVVDSNLCLSYLTIEHRGPVGGDVRGRYEGWIYGCDTCQDVCPWNLKFETPSEEPAFFPREGFIAPPLEEWRRMDKGEFSARFSRSPVKRAKYEGLLRNIEIVLGSADPVPPSPSSHSVQDL
jgi:epoxyqueuosine reductase